MYPVYLAYALGFSILALFGAYVVKSFLKSKQVLREVVNNAKKT
ncbi:hypothetical protein ANAPRD1_00002 [Anaplasma phagocytophilum]|nr:hypothetical protein ANAPRD1_00002 [Anaplasma phagocytophilum]SCV65457.1 hypothetical protein ANAPH1_00818 [Anaplasma phagocytophilum]